MDVSLVVRLTVNDSLSSTISSSTAESVTHWLLPGSLGMRGLPDEVLALPSVSSVDCIRKSSSAAEGDTG